MAHAHAWPRRMGMAGTLRRADRRAKTYVRALEGLRAKRKRIRYEDEDERGDDSWLSDDER
jgi:hypothetical protein